MHQSGTVDIHSPNNKRQQLPSDSYQTEEQIPPQLIDTLSKSFLMCHVVGFKVRYGCEWVHLNLNLNQHEDN